MQSIIQQKWNLYESILLYLLIDFGNYDTSRKNILSIHQRFNHYARQIVCEETLAEKSIEQIQGKYTNLYDYQELYNRYK